MTIRSAVQDAASALLLQHFVVSKRSESSVIHVVGSPGDALDAASERYAEALHRLGVLDLSPDGRQAVMTTGAKAELRQAANQSIVSMVTHEWNQQALWVDVDRSLRGLSRDSQQDKVLAGDPPRLHALLSAMLEVDLQLSYQLAAIQWPHGAHIWDIAGGHGRHLCEILKVDSSLTGTVVDLPGAEEVVTQVSLDYGLNVGFQSADLASLNFLPPVGSDRAIFLFVRCLHNFSPRMRNAILSFVVSSCAAGCTLVVVNPAWEWTENGVTNSDVAIFNFYMCVNAIGGGVPSRGQIHDELSRLGQVNRWSLSDSLDIYVVHVGPSRISLSIPLDYAAPDAVVNVQTYGYERQVDGFIEASILHVVVKWDLDVFMRTSKTIWELEKYTGLSDTSVSGLLAALTAYRYVQPCPDGLFAWRTDAMLGREPSELGLLDSLLGVWNLIAAHTCLQDVDWMVLDELADLSLLA